MILSVLGVVVHCLPQSATVEAMDDVVRPLHVEVTERTTHTNKRNSPTNVVFKNASPNPTGTAFVPVILRSSPQAAPSSWPYMPGRSGDMWL